MGIHFRDSRTCRYVRFGKVTVKDGEAVAVWDSNGRHTQVVGPRFVRLIFSTIRFLDHFVAGPKEYLVITHKDGRIEHVQGPRAMFCNPVHHKSMKIEKAILLASPKECLVVYHQQKQMSPMTNKTAVMVDDIDSKQADDESDSFTMQTVHNKFPLAARNQTCAADQVMRRVVVGPALFMPEVGEWTHGFEWTKLSGGKTKNKFMVLSTGARRWDTNVPLRTADSVLITANISLQFNVQDVTSVLEACEDPIAALQSLLSADLAEFGTLVRSDDLLDSEARNKITVKLGDMFSYKKLLAGAKQMGLSIVSLCMRGIDASKELQCEYDKAIALRARLKADRAAAELEQQLVDLKLKNQKRRIECEQALAVSRLEHGLKLTTQQQQQQLAANGQNNEQVLGFLKELRKSGVDLTQYLVSFSGQKATIGNLTSAPAFSDMAVPAPKGFPKNRKDEK